MTTEVLTRLSSQNESVIKANMEGITDAEALSAIPGGANPINWILGHIAFWRDSMLQMAGGEAVWTDGAGDQYRGDPGKRKPLEFNPETALPVARLLDDLSTMRTRLAARLETMRPEDLAVSPGGGATLGQILTSLHVHEAYHSGQLGVLRRVIGRKGAV